MNRALPELTSVGFLLSILLRSISSRYFISTGRSFVNEVKHLNDISRYHRQRHRVEEFV